MLKGVARAIESARPLDSLSFEEPPRPLSTANWTERDDKRLSSRLASGPAQAQRLASEDSTTAPHAGWTGR